MKIAITCHHFNPFKGGMEKYTYFLSNALGSAGHKVHVFANTFKDNPNLVYHHVPMIRLSNPGKNLSFAYFLKKRLQREKFDIVHSMERVFEQDIYRVSDGINPVQVKQRYANPRVRKIKNAGPRRQVMNYLEKKIFVNGGCRRIMTNSNLIKTHILQHYPVDPGKISVIYNGVDTAKFTPSVRQIHRARIRQSLGISETDPVLLFVGNNFKLKGLELILRAMRRLKDIPYTLLVAGNDDPAPYLNLAKRQKLEDHVHFIGPRKQIEKFYGAADIFVLPTLYDAFANVCLEAMACGLPVITSSTNGSSELIENGREGYVLEQGTCEELSDRLCAMVSDETRTSMSIASARKASRFTLEKHLSEVLDLYEQVIAEKTS